MIIGFRFTRKYQAEVKRPVRLLKVCVYTHMPTHTHTHMLTHTHTHAHMLTHTHTHMLTHTHTHTC